MTFHAVILLLCSVLLLITGAMRLYIRVQESMVLSGLDRVRELLGWCVPFVIAAGFVWIYSQYPTPMMSFIAVGVVVSYFVSYPFKSSKPAHLR